MNDMIDNKLMELARSAAGLPISWWDLAKEQGIAPPWRELGLFAELVQEEADVEPDAGYHTRPILDDDGNDTGAAEYVLDENGERIPSSVCLCNAHSNSECCCGAWD